MTKGFGSNLDVAYTYNNEGAMTSVTYPSTSPGGVPTPGASYNYSYDSMMRLSGMTDSGSNSMVSGVSYGPSNELLGMVYRPTVATSPITEGRTYNTVGQMTNLTNTNYSGTIMNLQYVYPTATNNGKVSSQKDWVSGEEVTYAYDSLNRLISAVTTAASDAVTTPWGENYSYDGFGNLTAKTPVKGLPPTYSVFVDPATNRVSGTTYDANGNAYPYASSAYDVENRLTTVYAGSAAYGYDAQNKRFFTSAGYDFYGNPTGYTVALYSPGGQKLGTYRIDLSTFLFATLLNSDIYFGSRRISTMDRLGSVGKFYPYGEAKGGTNPADTWSFATYWRDSSSNLDYADQRYYQNQGGRFMSPDPYQASGGPADPQSWNRYSYTRGDPVNRFDPSGSVDCAPGDPLPCSTTVTAPGPGGGFFGGGGGQIGSSPTYAPLDPLPLTVGQLRGYATFLQNKVKAGIELDCDALADFVTAAGQGRTARQLDSMMANFVQSSLLTDVVGIPTSVAPINFVGSTSGFQPSVQNTNGDKSDQTHHFAAFFEIGFKYGSLAGVVLGNVFENYERFIDPRGYNQGDVNLANAAASLGADLAKGDILPEDLGSAIQSSLCNR